MSFTARCFLQIREYRVQIEGSWLLARRELLKGLDLAGYQRLHRVDEVDVRNHPVEVSVRVLVSSLKRIAPETYVADGDHFILVTRSGTVHDVVCRALGEVERTQPPA